MSVLLCFGLGYTARHYIARHCARFDRIIGTVRSAQRAAEARASGRAGLTTLVFDGTVSSEICAAIADAEGILVSAPPGSLGDPVLGACCRELARSSRLQSIGYLSSTGVYGDHQGAWVNEESDCRSRERHSLQRHVAERAWREFGMRAGVKVSVLRLAAIYGPDRNALVDLKRGAAKRIAKPGQVFNRIHVADIARSIHAAFEHPLGGIFNVADDEPTPPDEPILFAAGLLGMQPPPEISFAQPQNSMTATALSFFSETKRVCNTKLKSVLGVTLQFPTYREGLTHLFHSDDSAIVIPR
jgi:nucleoside-diphosphate-sugar epimerase